MSFLLQAQREKVGQQIRTARKSAGLSHDALAAKVRSSRQHLIKLEKGIHLPGEALLSRIAEATGRDVAFFDPNSGEDDGEPHRAMSLDDFLRLRIRELVRDEIGAQR